MADRDVRADMALRCARAAVLALVCTGLALCGHVLAGGPAPGMARVGAGFAVVFAGGAALLGRERGFGVITWALVVGQFGLHALFMGTHAGPHAAPGMPAMPSMPSGSAHVMVSPLLGLNLWMIAAHIAAACLTSGYLRFGESRLWRLIRLAGHRATGYRLLRWLMSCLDTAVAEPYARPAAPESPVRVRVRRWLDTRVVSWRGPPPVPVG